MKGIILAAGMGSRLKNRTVDCPKALVPVNGVSLIDYALNFLSPRMDEIIVIGGDRFNLLKEHLKKKKLNRLTLIENPDYSEGSILTIEKALDYLDDSFLLMNVDHIYPESFIEKILTHFDGITAMCDFDRNLVADDMKVKLNSDHKIAQIDKKLADYDGGYIGMTSCHRDIVSHYKQMIQKAIAKGERKVNVEYILQLFAGEKIYPNTLDLSGSQWLEIDDENDLKKAEDVLKANPSLIKQ